MLPSTQHKRDWLVRQIYRGILADDRELILVQDQAGDEALLRELVAALQMVGATPIVDYNDLHTVSQVLTLASLDSLDHFDHHRQDWWQRCQRSIVLTDETHDLLDTSTEAWKRWNAARERLQAIEQNRKLPTLVVAVPTERKAAELGISLQDLRELVESAQRASLLELQRETEKLLFACESAEMLTIETGAGAVLQIPCQQCNWIADDGYVDPNDLAKGARVSYLPAGALVATLAADTATGSVHLPSLGATVHVDKGQVVHLEATEESRRSLNNVFVADGQPLLLSHLTFGANPNLRRSTGWWLVDRCRKHAVTLSFGDNRHWGGTHAAPLSLDMPLESASVLVDNQLLIRA